MRWKIKQSKAKSARNVCVIKLNKNNLTGDFMILSHLGNYEYEYRPEIVGIYRIMNNTDTSSNSVKGCQLVYKLNHENFLRRLSISDSEVKNLSTDEIQSEEFINQLAVDKRAKFED